MDGGKFPLAKNKPLSLGNVVCDIVTGRRTDRWCTYLINKFKRKTNRNRMFVCVDD